MKTKSFKNTMMLVFACAFALVNQNFSVNGAETNNPWAVTGDVSSKLMGHYLSYRTGSSITVDPAVWTEINVMSRGFYAQVFNSQPLNTDEVKGQQIDIALGKRLDFGPWTIKAEYRFSDYNPLQTLVDFHYQTIMVSREMLKPGGSQSLRLGGYFEHLNAPGKFTEGTLFIQGGIVHSIKLGYNLSLFDAHWFSHAEKFKKMEPGNFYRAELGICWKPSNKWEITPIAVRIIAPLDSTREFDKALYTSVKFKF